MVSKILSDKIIIAENLKDYKPFGDKWLNHQDPDIYESELNLSQNEDE